MSRRIRDPIVQHVLDCRHNFVPAFQNPLDVDFYKYPMGNFIRRFYSGTNVVFAFICRNPNVKLAQMIPEDVLRQHFDYARTVGYKAADVAWLRGMRVYGANMFSEDYTTFLETFRLPEYKLTRVGDSYEIEFGTDGAPWEAVDMWETIALAIVSDLYYRTLMTDLSPMELEILYARAKNLLYEKLKRIKENGRIRFADFAQRRRHNFLWHRWCVEAAMEVLGDQFVGTSNTWMAFHYGLNPIGTNAHALPMVATALVDDNPDAMRNAPFDVCRQWQELYGQGLRIMLPDTYGSSWFFKNAPDFLLDWRGSRQDSGNPVTVGQLTINWWKSRGVDTRTKLFIPSDGLDVDVMESLDWEFGDQVMMSDGWGTLFGNDFRGCHPNDPLNFFRPIPIVCKPVSANGRPCVKLSDNPGKHTGPREAVEYYKKVFGYEITERQEVTT